MDLTTILLFGALFGFPKIKKICTDASLGKYRIARLPYMNTISYAQPKDNSPPTNTPEGLHNKLNVLENNPKIKGIILEINSGGGSSAASNESYEILKEFKKPKVALVKGICASGAYLVACGCDYIIASEDSLIGSIGVIMKKPNIEGLMKKLGVEMEVITAGKSKDSISYFKPMPEEEKKKLEELLQRSHKRFIETVYDNRCSVLPLETLKKFATGEVTDGFKAKRLGLIDELGNMNTAIKKCEALGNFKHSSIQLIQDKQGFFNKLMQKSCYNIGRGLADGLSEMNSSKEGLYREH